MDSKIKYTPSRAATWETTDGSIFDRVTLAERHQDGLNKPKWLGTPNKSDALCTLKRIQRDMRGAFSWGNTSQGFDYWNEVDDNFIDMVNELEG